MRVLILFALLLVGCTKPRELTLLLVDKDGKSLQSSAVFTIVPIITKDYPPPSGRAPPRPKRVEAVFFGEIPAPVELGYNEMLIFSAPGYMGGRLIFDSEVVYVIADAEIPRESNLLAQIITDLLGEPYVAFWFDRKLSHQLPLNDAHVVKVVLGKDPNPREYHAWLDEFIRQSPEVWNQFWARRK